MQQNSDSFFVYFMETVELTNYTCNYRLDNSGKKTTLVLSNSLGTSLSMWDVNLPYLSSHFNILRQDTRGHGHSTIRQDEVTIAELAGDVIELIDYLELEHVVFCGLSIGGLIGQYLAIYYPDRFQQFILCNTSPKIGTTDGWNARIKQVTEHGLSSILDGTAQRWFSAHYRETEPSEVQIILRDFARTSLRGYTACCGAVRDADFRQDLGKISGPVLIISGSEDEVTTVEDGNYMQERIPGAEHISLEAAHLSNKEFPQQFAEAIISFCSK